MVMFVLSCQNKQTKHASKLVITHNAVTPITSDAPITIHLSEHPELFDALAPEDKSQVVVMNPAVAGKVFLIENNQLVFQHDKPLKYGRSYEITIHLDKIFNHPDNNTFKFNIKVLPLQVDLFFDNLKPLKDEIHTLYKLTGRIVTSESIDSKMLSDAVTAKLNDKPLPVTIVQGEDPQSFNFSIDKIKRTKQNQKLTVTINNKAFGDENNRTYEYVVPPDSLFSFINYSIKKEPEPHIILTFSDNISTEQNLDGLLFFENGTPIKISRKGNQILVYPNKKITGTYKLIISKSIKNSKGQSLDKQYSIEPVFKQAAPAVRFLGKGNILPGDNKWIIPFESINLNAVDVVIFKIYSNNIMQFLQNNELGDGDWSLNKVGEYVHHEKIILEKNLTAPDNKWKTRAIDLSKMINSEPGAIYRVSLKFKKAYALLEQASEVKNNKHESKGDSTRYFYSNYYYPYNYSWSKRNNPNDISYYNYNHFPSRNFIAGNIGLIVKNYGKNGYTVYARNLIDTEPIANATIRFFSFQKQLLSEVTTNDKGEAKVLLKKHPFFVVAQWDNQFAYLKLKGGNALSFSKFNTSGVTIKNGLKGYIFGERGVWRPGDTLFLTFVLQDTKEVLPEGHPIKLELRDARDRKVYSKSRTIGTDGFYVFKIPTSQDAPTGIWNARVQVGNEYFRKSIRIETILPNRLKIYMTTEDNHFVAGRKGTLKLEAKWLHGGLASDLKASVIENIRRGNISFEHLKGFIFSNPADHFSLDEQSIYDGKLNDKGEAEANVILPEGDQLPSKLNLTFVTKVFEPGGRFSIDQKSFDYTPYTQYIGIKPPDKGNSRYFETDKKQLFNVVTVDDEGNDISIKNLKVEVYKLDWSWWYSSNNSNLANYISQHYFDRVISKTISTTNGKGTFSFTIKYPNWGNYYVKVSDENGSHSAGMIFYIDWPSSYSRGNRKAPGDATLLSLTSDKNGYTAGDTATISFPSTPNSKALISIEKNNKIIKTWWIDTKPEESSFKLVITKDMTPNVYAFVSVIQPHAQTINDLPIRSYGVLPIMVNDPSTVLTPVLSAPPEIKPEADYTLKVSEANGRKMTYVLAVVDEGLLDLTHFKTPSLRSYFYKKEALAVRTFDLYDDVNGAFGSKLSQVFAIGGDEELKELGKKKVNRFKPVVTFLGPFTIDKGSKGKTHHLKMSNYIGSVRVMVIAGHKGAYGKTEKTIPVKQPLMVLASMPRMLVPGETLKLPVTVFVMDNTIKTVTLKAKGNDLFSIDNGVQTLTFDRQGEKIAYVNLKVNDQSGVGKVQLTVLSGKNRASYNVSISIRNPNERVYQTMSYAIEKGKIWNGKPKFMENATSQKLMITVSKIPSINLEQRVQYLIHYPYGCIEQTVSSVFPQLFLSKLTYLTKEQAIDIEGNIKRSIQRINFFQQSSGGFSYWPGRDEISDWGTSYAGHFLILAKEAGYYIPSELLNKWIGYQQKMASRWKESKSKYYSYDFGQAYRLYTLAIAGKPNLSAMNRMREYRNLSQEAALRLAAAYAILNEKTVAKSLIDAAINIPIDNRNYWYNYGSHTRNMAMALETYLLLDNKAKAFELFKDIAADLGSGNWMSTQTTAFSLYAVSLFTDNKQQSNYQFSYQYNGDKSLINSDKPLYSIELPPVQNRNLKVANKSDQMLFLNIETSAIPNPGESINRAEGISLNATYYGMNREKIDPATLKQGKDFYVKIVVKNSSPRNYHNLALSAVFPSGWEILNTRMNSVGQKLHSSGSNYLDIRDDRVNIFFNLTNGLSKTYYILLNAAYPGHYFQAPITCKEMYNNSINAAVGGGMVEVKQN